MSTPAPAQTKAQKKKEKDKENDKEKKSVSQPNERLKTVVRRLPPNLPEEIFWQSVQQWVTDETVTWKVYYPGKLRKKLNKENVPSRAYIAFTNEELLATFSRDYDGHVFRDKAGVESQAIVEFAPYPKIPSEKRKADSRNATIEKDEDYISFIESLKTSETTEPVSLETMIAASQPPPPPKTTPLLEALKAEKSAARDKEAILRNHAHYNQIMTRKEEKKKANAALSPPLAKGSDTAPPTPAGKKPSKKEREREKAEKAAQNVKTAATSSQSTKNATNTAMPTKLPRHLKPRQPPHQATQSNDTRIKHTEESIPSVPVDIATPATSIADGGSASTPAPVPRRIRPVIGLGSRQFEAALSGVAGLANAAAERKRREREAQAATNTSSTSTAVLAAGVPPKTPITSNAVPLARIDSSDNEMSSPTAVGSVVPTPTTPTKKKTRRGNGGKVKKPPPGDSSSGQKMDGPPLKVPSILQRNPTSDGPPGASTTSAGGAPPPSNNVFPSAVVLAANVSGGLGSAPGEGPGRGRGRGRGRGGRGGAPRGS